MTAHRLHATPRPQRLRPRFALRPLALALASGSLLSVPGLSTGQVPPSPPLPSGLNVVQGQAKAVVTGQQLTVTNTANSILNWQSFSIGSQHGVTFVQPNAQSQVLNRVTGNDPSSILGSLTSNGRVWLVNPNGVIFGQGARIDVAGLVTSTLNLNDLDWLGGRYAFSAVGKAAGIVNQGELRTSLGGQIALIGGSVRNEGVIEAHGGQVLIAAGHSVELVDTGAPNLRLKITAPQGEVLNLGTLAGGRIDVHAAVLNQQGIVRADSLGTNAAGEIVLGATQQLNLGAGSVTSASGGSGGRLMLDSGVDGTTLVQGRVEATGSTGQGGSVQLLGRQVGLLDGARVDVSGSTGGGQTLVGGGERGQDPTVRNAQAVYVAAGAVLSADARGQGDGGRIVLWGNEATRAYGSFSARGGSAGGNGGFIETSGGFLDAQPARIDTSAPTGRAGTWLLDPYDIFISDVVSANTGITQTGSNPVNFSGSTSPSQIDPRTIVTALNAGNSVVISTSTGGTEPGDITVQRASINAAPNVPVSLTLQAARRIDVSGSTIASDGSLLSVNLQAAGSGSGSVNLASSSIRSAGGNITVNGVGYDDVRAGSGYGVRIASASLTAGAGNITLNGGRTATTGSELAGVSLTGANLSGRDITISGNANSQAVSTANGVEVLSSSLQSTHALSISGSSTGTGVSIDSAFSSLSVTPAAADPSAAMTISGSSSWTDFSAAGYRNYGVDIVGQYGGGLQLTNGARLSVSGSNVAGGLPSLSLRGGVVIGGPTAGDALLSGNNSASLGTNMAIGGRIRASANELTIPGGSTLRSDATGDALVAVSGSALTSRFDNQAGGSAFNTPNGRWLVFGRDTTRVLTGGLAAAFKQYGAALGSTGPLTPATRNGLLYTDTPVIVFNGATFSKPYDGSTFAGPLNPTRATPSGLRDADVLSFVAGATANFADPNAGNNKPIGVAANSFTVADANGIPVLGYGVSSNLRGDILRRNLSFDSVVVANKVYDGNTTASVAPGAATGLVGSETLTASATGSFNNPNVGTSKPVTVTITLADGTGPNAGLASNYQYSNVLSPELPSGYSANITPRPLTVRANDANKTFGNTLSFTGTEFTATGLVPGETVGSVTLASTGAPASASVAGSPYAIIASNATGGSFAASNYGISYANGTLTVTPAVLNAVLASIVGNPSKAYDGTDTATLAQTNYSLSGFAGSDGALITQTVGRYDSANAGARTVTATLASGDFTPTGSTDLRNYTLPTSASGSGTITPRLVSVTGLLANNKVYDSNTLATLANGGSLSGLVGAQTLTHSNTGASFSDRNAGTGKTVTVTGLSLGNGTGLASNYQLASSTATTTADITPRPLTVRANDANNTFGNTLSFTGTEFTATGLVPGETVGSVTLASTGAPASASVAGSPYAIIASNATGGSFAAANYGIGYVDGTLTVTPAVLNAVLASIVGNPSKAYDGTDTATLAQTNYSLSGFAGSDGALITQTVGRYDSANAGARTVTATLASGDFTPTGSTDLRNYTLPTSASGSGTITPRLVSVTGLLANNKVYDSNTLATLANGGSLSGLVGAQTLTLSNTGASFSDRNAGTGKTVTVTGLSLGNGTGLASNYQLASSTATTTADITPRLLTLSGLSAASKVYDGNTTASVSVASLNGLVGSETLLSSSTGRFDTQDAGTGKAVSVSTTLADGSNGGLAANYRTQPAVTTADVTPKLLTLSGVSAASKVYDGNTTASVSVASLNGLVGSETLLSSSTGRFDTQDAGTGKAVSVSTTLADGSNGGLAANYRTQPAVTTADITPKLLTLSGVSAASKVYDGNTTASVNLGVLNGLVGAETLQLVSGPANFDTKDAGTGKVVSVAGLRLGNGNGNGGGLATNYRLASDTAATTADITPRTLTLGPVSAADKVYDGNTRAVVTLGPLGNLVGSETLLTSATGRFDTQDVGSGKRVDIDIVLANGGAGGLSSNYQLPAGTAVQARAAVTPATLVYTADPASKLAGAPVPPLAGSVSGFVAGETLATATRGNLAFTTPAVATSPPGRYAIDGSGLAAGNYRFVQADSNATALEVRAFQPPSIDNGSRAPLALALGRVGLPPTFSTPSQGRVLDVLQALRGRVLGEGALFDPVRLGELSFDELTSLLAARDLYKKTLFADAIRRLEQDPTLADLPPCPGVKEVENGSCLITEDLKRQLRAERGGVQVATSPPPAPAAPPVPAPSAAPAPAPAASTTPAPAPAPTVTPAPAAPVVAAAPPAPAPLLRRRVRSASLPQIERKVAVVIGIDRYTDRSIPQLDNAVRDAKAIGNLLENTLGYETVVLQNAGKQDVVRALNRLAVDLGPNDSVVVYYAGHGELVEATKLGYWQLADSDAKRPETWLSNADITRLVGRIGASQVALISDSCYSGSLVDERLRPTGGTVDPGQLLTRKTVVVMSSGGNEPVFDAGKRGHSPFAFSLMNNLERVANWQVGGNVFERVRFAVARELPQRPRYGTAAAAGHEAGGDYLFEQRQLDAAQ